MSFLQLVVKLYHELCGGIFLACMIWSQYIERHEMGQKASSYASAVAKPRHTVNPIFKSPISKQDVKKNCIFKNYKIPVILITMC